MNASIAALKARRGGLAFLKLSWLTPLIALVAFVTTYLLVINDIPQNSKTQGWSAIQYLAPLAAAVLGLALLLTLLIALCWTAIGVTTVARSTSGRRNDPGARGGAGFAALGVIGLVLAYLALRVELGMLFGIS